MTTTTHPFRRRRGAATALAKPLRLVYTARMKTEAWLIERLNEQAAAVRAAPPRERSATNGVPAELFTVCKVRDLEPVDLLERQTNGADTLGAEPFKLKRLRYTHHNLARMLAQRHPKLTQVEISAQTGYSEKTITSYKRDPAFRELIVQYEKEYANTEVDVVAKLETLAIDILVEISDRLENDPESLSTAQLLECSKLTLDRSGYGPITKQLNLTANVSAEVLTRIKENVQAEEKRRINLAATNGALERGLQPQGSVVEGRLAATEISETEGEGRARSEVREENGEVPLPVASAV